MQWRALIIPVLAGTGLGLAACGGGSTASPDAHWYHDGYNFGVGVDQRGSPYVQVDSPTQFCNAALGALGAADFGESSRLASTGGRGAGGYPTSDGTDVPRNVPPVSDTAAEAAWVAGCVAALTTD